MRGAILPDALLAAAFGFAVSFSKPGVQARTAPVLIVVAIAVAMVPISGVNDDLAFTGCWLSVLATAALVHLKGGMGAILATLVAVNDGAWAGLVTHVSHGALALAFALPAILTVIPGRLLVRRGWGIGVKVAASWLIAIAFLEAALVLVPTPGYKPDHMD
jgi:hypothetical protein